MTVYEAETFAEAYEKLLRDLLYAPEYNTSPRGMQVNEIMNAAIVVKDPSKNLYTNIRRSSQKRYIAAELVWYFMGWNNVSFIEKYSKFWKNIENEDGTANSAYGKLIFNKKNRFGLTQYQWAHNSLVSDEDSRQAILHFNMPEHQYSGNKDFVCTVYGSFHIRNNKLDLTVCMRSNDAILGLPTDFTFFSILQQQMLSHLKKKYPTLELGKYTHLSNSMHIYEQHFVLVKEMLENEFFPVSTPTLKNDLILNNGQPTTDFSVLSSNLNDDPKHFSDELYRWILENVNK